MALGVLQLMILSIFSRWWGKKLHRGTRQMASLVSKSNNWISGGSMGGFLSHGGTPIAGPFF